MAFKLALSAGHYLYTPGKRCSKSIDPNETREWWLNDRIADRIEVLLKDYDGIQVLRLDDTTGKKEVTLRTRSDASNKWGADFYLAVHHNAGINGGKGGGITSHVYLTPSAESFVWQKELYNALIAATGLKGNRANPLVKQNLHECREPYCPAVLLELGFMDSTTDVPVILTQKYAYACAQACVDVIVKRAGLKKKATSSSTATTTPSSASTYKLVTSVNKYTTAADAKAKKNSTGTYKAGTYYIFTKYPNGVDGMFNITTDKTGKEAGAWINPAENKIKESEDKNVQKLYRVRTSWDDAKSQKGAFSSLDNAKACCQESGKGYKVFDWNGKEVYAYKAPTASSTTTTTTTTKPAEKPVEKPAETTPKKVYELNYPEKHQIIEYDFVATEGINEEECTRAIIAIKKNNPDFDIEIAKAFFLLADEYHINPMRAIAQSILETGWFKFAGSSVKASQHNYCGLGATGGGVSGASFNTIENGVRAQLQHLYAYGCKDALPKDEATIVDPRFKYVTRGIAVYWEQLAGRWAVPGYDGSDPEAAMAKGLTYGQKIDNIYEGLMKTKVTKTEIKKYFVVVEEAKPEVEVKPETKPEVKPAPEQDPVVETPEENTDKKVNFIVDIVLKVLRKLAEIFIDNFKK
jgi:N-acetylmuramoyl-L-alanine amidase